MTTVRKHLPKGDFSIMTEMLKKFLSFMNLTVSMSVKNHLLSSAFHNDAVSVLIKEMRHLHQNKTIVTNQIDFFLEIFMG